MRPQHDFTWPQQHLSQALYVKTEDYKAFLGYCTCFTELVDVHHNGEEEILFPQIEEMSGRLAMEKNVERSIIAFTVAWRGSSKGYITSCLKSSNPVEFDGRELVRIIDSFGHDLATHLKEEINTLLDLRIQWSQDG